MDGLLDECLPTVHNAGEGEEEDDGKDTCNMCGGSGYLDLERTQVCPNCKGTGRA